MEEKNSARKGIWDRAYQVGVVVHDLDRATEFYERLGIGPFVEGPSAHTVERRVFGKDAPDAAVKGVIAQMGSIEFELLQPMGGTTVQGEFLKNHGEGIVHICAYSEDIDADRTELEGLGYEVISWGVLEDGGKFAYFDTAKVGGIVLELFQPGESWN